MAAAVLDLMRFLVGVSVLTFAAYTDWHWRRAPNALWLVIAGVGVVALAAEAALAPEAFLASWPNLLFIPIFAAVIYVLWYFGMLAGGADAKAFMALGVLLPFPVRLGEALPFVPNPVPGWPAAVAVLGNSLLLFLVVPLGFLVWNVLHRDVRLPHAFLGVKRVARRVTQGHMWPMETIDPEGKRRSRFYPSRMEASEIDEHFARVQALGDERVWVTPKVPFMLPLLAGFVTTFIAGDLLFAALALVMP